MYVSFSSLPRSLRTSKFFMILFLLLFISLVIGHSLTSSCLSLPCSLFLFLLSFCFSLPYSPSISFSPLTPLIPSSFPYFLLLFISLFPVHFLISSCFHFFTLHSFPNFSYSPYSSFISLFPLASHFLTPRSFSYFLICPFLPFRFLASSCLSFPYSPFRSLLPLTPLPTRSFPYFL